MPSVCGASPQSNIMLNELGKELEARRLHFIKYADDSVIRVRSSATANRVMATVTKWIEKKLALWMLIHDREVLIRNFPVFYCRKGGGSMAMITVKTSDDLREFIIRELKDGVVISVDLSSEEERSSDRGYEK